MATPKQIDKLRTAAQVGVTISGATLIPAKMQDGTEAFKMSITELSPFLTDKGLRIGTTGIISGTLQDVKDAAATNTGIKLSNTTFEYTGIFTFASKTASTLIYLNASKQVTSLANSAGVLTNNGSGALSWVSLGGYVPYTGAVTDLMLGINNVQAQQAILGDYDGLGDYVTIWSNASAIEFEGFGAAANEMRFVTSAISLYKSGKDLTVSIDGSGNIAFALSHGTLYTFDKSISARVRPRTAVTNAPGATPSTDTDALDFKHFTGVNADITDMTTNLTGTPTEAQKMWWAFTPDASNRAITWGSGFENGAANLPTLLTASTRLDAGFIRNTVTNKWRCMAAG